MNPYAKKLSASGAAVGLSPEPLATSAFLEGPAASTDGKLLFSDILANRIYQWSGAAGMSVFRDDAGRANGNVLTRGGLLYTCEGGEMGAGGRRRIVRTDTATGEQLVLADRYLGRRLNSPNDLTVGADGTVWFTDPRYGTDRSDLELEVEGVYRIDSDGTLELVLDQRYVQRPNGIALSPDERTLYVVDSHPAPGGSRRVIALPLWDGRACGTPRVVYDFGSGRGGDGIKVDRDGRLYVCAGIHRSRSSGEDTSVPTGVYVMDSQGVVQTVHPIPLDVLSNCCFGGPDDRTLFVTAGHTVFSMQVDRPGHRV